MAQQLNLYDPRFVPVAPRFSARQAGAAVLLCLGAGALITQGLQWATRDALAQAQVAEKLNQPLRQHLLNKAKVPVESTADIDTELAQLQQIEAGQRRIRAALDAGVAGTREGPSGFLEALARQAGGQVWITGFTVSEDGDSLLLDGRMTDASALTDYLRRLNAEARFRGRPFSQLSLQAVSTPDGQAQYTEFSLRAVAVPPPLPPALTATSASP
jgi:Tfp pilus assembly protein PilN